MPAKCKLFLFVFFLLFFISSSKVSAQVVINEYLPRPSSGPDWIELYSPIDSDISEYILRDTTSDMKKLLSGVIIGPSTSTSCYVDVSNRLNNGGDTILLLQADGSLPAVDEHSYSSAGVDVSWCRSPDGGAWDTCTTATKTLIECDSLVPTPTPTSTPTPTPTSVPTLTSTPTPTPTLTPTPTPKPTVKAAATAKSKPKTTKKKNVEEGQGEKELILGLREGLGSPPPSPTPASEKKKKFPTVAALLVFSGLGFLGAAAYPFLKRIKKEYNGGGEQDTGEGS